MLQPLSFNINIQYMLILLTQLLETAEDLELNVQ